MHALMLAALLANADPAPESVRESRVIVRAEAAIDRGQVVVFRTGNQSMWKARLADDALVDLTPIHELDGRDLGDLALSPDGGLLAYTSQDASGPHTELFDLRTGTRSPLIPRAAGTSRGPAWSDDGLHIAVTVQAGAGVDIAVVDRFGGAIKRLGLHLRVGDCAWPAWGHGWLAHDLYCVGANRLRVWDWDEGRVKSVRDQTISDSLAAVPRRIAVHAHDVFSVLFETALPREGLTWPKEGLPALAQTTIKATATILSFNPPDLVARAPQFFFQQRFLFLGFSVNENQALLSSGKLPPWDLYARALDDDTVKLIRKDVSEIAVAQRSADRFLLAHLAVQAGEPHIFQRPDCGDPSSSKMFFPEGAFTDRDMSDAFERRWYSSHLREMGEPSLSCQQQEGERYRFLWLRTWGAPIAVRIDADSVRGRRVLSMTELDGAGGYRPGKVAARLTRDLTDDEWRRVSAGLTRIDFWTLPPRSSRFGYDGADWILEGRRGGQYHAVRRWSPERGAYRDLCELLLKLAGFPGQRRGKARDIY